MNKFEGKTAVITGGDSGIGHATAGKLVEEGAYVFITGRRQPKLDEAVKQIGKNVTGVQGDVSNLADLDRLYATVEQQKGSIDILFANAGLGEPTPLPAISEAQFDKRSTLTSRAFCLQSKRHFHCLRMVVRLFYACPPQHQKQPKDSVFTVHPRPPLGHSLVHRL
jgi:NAD(P)-dependent dehydrogenase (short-subunit alcohol dehydrogenase family)